ncbi:MAG: peptidase S8 [Ignavibacteriae bacterium]|nr:MAG: peptidase S8 [Ignavibacteriota bacterium]
MSFGTNPLPVELTTFNAVINNKLKNIELNWQTATEVNNYGFEVERIAQNKDTQNNKWEKIAFINGHGNSNSPKFYNYSDNTVSSGKFQYRLKQIDFDGKYSYSNVVEVNLGLPTEFSLKQNYPNPFNPSTVIEYTIPSTGMEQSNQVILKVYDILGNEVATLVNKQQPAGNYKIKFNANNLSNGVYFYKLTSGNYTATKKLMLMK